MKKNFEVQILSNVNISFLNKLLTEFKNLGCNISNNNGNIKIEYDEILSSKLEQLFNKLLEIKKQN